MEQELNRKLAKQAGYKGSPEQRARMDAEALAEKNKKLAEWAGFVGIIDYPNKASIGHPSTKSGLFIKLDFTQSLDACFKWLVPKLSDYFIGSSVDGHTATVWNISYSYGAKAETPALALCKAIERLIGDNNGSD